MASTETEISQTVIYAFIFVAGAACFLIMSTLTLARRIQIRHDAGNLLQTEIPTLPL